MRLLSFQIKNCFGFRDSDPVDLVDPSNLIYVLGRNSAGKTSFLTALAHLSPERIPQDHPNFANYNRPAELSQLIARYSLDASDLSVDVLIRDVCAALDASNQGDSLLTASTEYSGLQDAWERELRPLYTERLDEFRRAKTAWVARHAGGSYDMSPEEDLADAASWRQRVSMAIANAWRSVAQPNAPQPDHLLVGGGWRAVHLLSPEQIDAILLRQFPRIVWFGQEYKLNESLPTHITQQNVRSEEPLLQAFIGLLGLEDVQRFLVAEDPEELDALKVRMQRRLNDLLDEVNRAARADRNPDLLQMTLYSSNGLQISVKANSAASYYKHISDNTKILFAYFLYLRTRKIAGTILLFDEPSNGFHASAQEELLRFLQQLGKQGNLVIVSTHSEHLIDPDHLTGVRIMDVDGQYLRVRNRWYQTSQGKGDLLALRPIMDAIGLKYGANHLSIHDKVVVTEGVTDLLYLRALRRLLGYTADLHISPANGADAIQHVVALLIGQGLRFKVVLDQTIGRKGAKERLQDAYPIPDASIYEIPVPAGSGAKGSGIEDLFSKADFTKLLAATGNPPGPELASMTNSAYMSKHAPVPKRVVAHHFLLHIGDYRPDEFEPETIENARRVLDFCRNDDWFEL